MSYWREEAAEVIQRVLKETRGQSEKEVRIAVSAAYPFGRRRHHPYKIWLSEVKKRLGPRKTRKSVADSLQIGLFGGAQ